MPTCPHCPHCPHDHVEPEPKTAGGVVIPARPSGGRDAHPFTPAPPEAKEAEEELPPVCVRCDNCRYVFDLRALVPKLPDAQKQSLLDAVNPWAKSVRDGIRAERDAANALARSVQNNCDNLARELAEMTKRAEDSQTACTEAFNDAVGQEAKRIDLTKQLAEMTKRAETAEEERRDTLIDAGVHAIWDGRERAVARVVEIAAERDALTARLATVTAERDKWDEENQKLQALVVSAQRERDKMRPVVEALHRKQKALCGDFGSRLKQRAEEEAADRAVWAALRALDAAPPEEAKRCKVCGCKPEHHDRADHAFLETLPGHGQPDPTPHPAVATGTGRCASCGMFADELPHSEAFAHRHDFVPMTDARQLRAALVAAHARIAALESEAADVAERQREACADHIFRENRNNGKSFRLIVRETPLVTAKEPK